MILTLSQWIIIGIIGIIGLVFAIGLGISEDAMCGVIIGGISLIICVAIMLGCNWYNTKTAAGARGYKDYQSNINNGIERSLKIVADDGYVIYSREGKFDIEIHNDYIVFDEDGERTILYRSYTSTLIIEETEEAVG